MWKKVVNIQSQHRVFPCYFAPLEGRDILLSGWLGALVVVSDDTTVLVLGQESNSTVLAGGDTNSLYIVVHVNSIVLCHAISIPLDSLKIAWTNLWVDETSVL